MNTGPRPPGSSSEQVAVDETMEHLWESEVQKYYNKDGTGIKSILDLALADSLQQINGYHGFDANLYWNLQSVTSEIERMSMVKIEETMKTQELKNNGQNDKLQDDLVESRSAAEKKWRDVQGKLSTSVSSNDHSQHISPPATHDLSTSTTTSVTPFYTWTPYVHPGILRRKIDESYEFDEDSDTPMGE
ncbi:hypothetical protein QTJ16_003284 [Diplocarpon rosae]|uniref:Uncharacterized protein n=1 Tax=Diplocarpon rosae TaxID=946125 RepID=A0AAD9WEI1_9HELO|nr:hypothetical protein QTJ16_003284 [Diplocarpon rosae]